MAIDTRGRLPLRRGQALMELAVGMFALALVVSALTLFAVYIAKSLRSQNTVRASSKSGDTVVEVGAFASEWIFGWEKKDVREKAVMPPTVIIK